MYGIIVGTVVTCIFDVLFIAIMDMGIAGAGWAMVLANVASMLYYLLFLMRKARTSPRTSVTSPSTPPSLSPWSRSVPLSSFRA